MCKTIKQKVKFRAKPEWIYRLLADSRQHGKLTGQNAKISRKVGGPFSTHRGRVSGINVDLVPGKRLVQAWRRQDFPIGIFSMATIQLSHLDSGATELVLTHRGVPKTLIPQVESDWRNIWQKIRDLLSPKQ